MRWVTRPDWDVFIHSRSPLEAFACISLLSASVTRRNNSGERGQPFLRLLEAIKKCEAEPLTRIEKFIDENQASIYLNETPLKPHLKK